VKQIFYLCGLPRAGNTLLSSILNQNPNIAVTSKSIVTQICEKIFRLKKEETFLNFPDHTSIDNVIKNVMNNYYQDWKQDIIIDRGGWSAPNNLKFVKKYLNPKPKIILLVRDVLEILASFIDWSDKTHNSFIHKANANSIDDKCNLLMKNDGLIVAGLIEINNMLKNESKEDYLLIEYNNLVKNPKKTIKDIYKFLNIKYFNHTFINLHQFKINGTSYDDSAVGDNLHKIKTKIIKKTKRNINKIISKSIIEKYNNLNVWQK